MSVCKDCHYYRKHESVGGFVCDYQCYHPNNTCHTSCGKRPSVFFRSIGTLQSRTNCSWYKPSIKKRLKDRIVRIITRSLYYFGAGGGFQP